MDYEQEQAEELEVLLSIYEEDERFTKIDEKTFQYKFGEDGHYKSFVLEIKWTSTYPEIAPTINLDAFYNKHIRTEIKESIVSQLLEQCEANLGCAVTYTLFDWTSEHFEELTQNQTEVLYQQSEAPEEKQTEEQNKTNGCESSKKEKKEKLTKQQKRKQINRLNAKGELERGWNWVDVVRHLSKTAST